MGTIMATQVLGLTLALLWLPKSLHGSAPHL